MPIQCTCSVCGRVTMQIPSRTTKYCSYACHQAGRRAALPQPEALDDGQTFRLPLCAPDGSIRAYALVDATDIEWVNQWRWHLGAGGYAIRMPKINKRKRIVLLHRELLGLKSGDGMEGDHINRDRLDNRRCNLRAIPGYGNRQNVPGRSNTSSVYRGVTWNKAAKRWQAQIRYNGVQETLGFFSDEDEAGRVALEARQRLLPFSVD